MLSKDEQKRARKVAEKLQEAVIRQRRNLLDELETEDLEEAAELLDLMADEPCGGDDDDDDDDDDDEEEDE